MIEPADASSLLRLIGAIVAGEDIVGLEHRLTEQPDLATAAVAVGATRSRAADFWLPEVGHHLYAGDTALHLAAAGHRPEVVDLLLERGAGPNAPNRRAATPLHLAADGAPGSDRWVPDRQVAVIDRLIAAGARLDVADAGGATPLHRAVRTRCAAAVEALLRAGADPAAVNRNGSTAADLATRTTGRGGSGGAAARAEQQQILRLLAR